MAPKKITIRKAKITDVKQIHSLINAYARKNLMLPRALTDIYDNLQCYFVAVNGEQILASCALCVTWEDLAEIRSLAVDPSVEGRGIGKKLVARCMKEAKNLLIKRVFALTFVPDFFRKIGFKDISRDQLPHKVWGDCIRCHLFPDCGELPLIRDV
ncbi:MAG: N-acetyltransferase [bacterium]